MAKRVLLWLVFLVGFLVRSMLLLDLVGRLAAA